jgi:putative heme-binding domain-containing protein
MRRLSDPSGKDLLLKAFGSDDPFVQQAARLGLRNSLKANELVALAGSKDLSAEQRLGLLLILRDSDDSDAKTVLPGFLSDPDPRIRFGAIQWVGEHRLKEFRSTLQSGLASSADARNLFEATLAALERLDGKTRGLQDEIAGEDYVAALVKDERTPGPVLQQALRMLRTDHPALTIDRFKRLLGNHSEVVRIEAVRSLCQSARGGRFEILAGLAGDQSASSSIRAEAIAGLAEKAAAHREVLLTLSSGAEPTLRHEALRSLRGVSLTDGERSMLRRSSGDDAAGLELVDFLQNWGASGHSKSNGAPAPGNDINAISAQLNGTADPTAGERVFFHTKGPGCYRCHQVQGRGSRAGPDLTALPAGTSRQRLIESIVSPNKEIAPQFVAYAVARNDGTIFTGILLAQSPEGELIFADSQGRKIQIKGGEIAERKPQAISIMPEDLARTMTKQEMRDLLAFLLHKK